MVLAAVLAIALGVLVSTLYVVFTTVRVAGPSMEPTLFDEDRVLVTKQYDVAEHGDIVAATLPDEAGRPTGVIKRVVAVAGDTVEMIGDSAYVNGLLVPGDPVASGSEVRLPPIVVPAEHVYLLGDNRAVSYDSRFVGPVPVANVDGEVVAIIAPIGRFRIID